MYLVIYPNGDRDGCKKVIVSVYIMNPTPKQVFVESKLQIGDQDVMIESRKDCFDPCSGWGLIIDHNEVYPKFKSDQDLKITCKVMKLTTV